METPCGRSGVGLLIARLLQTFEYEMLRARRFETDESDQLRGVLTTSADQSMHDLAAKADFERTASS